MRYVDTLFWSLLSGSDNFVAVRVYLVINLVEEVCFGDQLNDIV
jgi:hypothetical protein